MTEIEWSVAGTTTLDRECNPIIEGTSTVLSIWKEKCDHSPEIRTFKTLSLSTSFEKLKKKKKKKKKSSLPLDPNLEDLAIGNTYVFLFGLSIYLKKVKRHDFMSYRQSSPWNEHLNLLVRIYFICISK